MDTKMISIQKLNGKNFYMWKFKVELLLQREKLWNIVSQDPPTPLPDEWSIRDQAAKATICLSMEDNLLINVRDFSTAKETWSVLNKIYEHSSLSSKLHLMRKLYGTRYQQFNHMREYINAILELVGQLSNLGEQTKEKNIIAILLCGLPQNYFNLITAIESKPEDELTLEYVKIKLLDEADRREGSAYEMESESTAMPAYRTSDRYRPITCYGCGQNGHTKRQCTKMYSYNQSPNWRQNQHPNHVEYNQQKSYKPNTDTLMPSMELCYIQDSKTEIETNPVPTPDNECRCNKTETYTALSGTINTIPKEWILDSGASAHMTGNKNFFSQITYLKKNIPITLANGVTVYANATGEGFVCLDNDIKKSDNVKICNVLFVPDLKFSLLSIKQLCNRGYRVTFGNDMCIIRNGEKSIACAKLKGASFILEESNQTPTANSCIHTWHNRLGHRSLRNIKETQQEVQHPNIIKDCNHHNFCNGCELGKMRQKSFHESNKLITKPFTVIVSDVCGPMQDRSLGGNYYILCIMDKFSRYVHVEMLRQKSQVSEKLKSYINKGHNLFQYYPTILRSDGGGEYSSEDLSNYLNSRGITHQVSAPHTPQQNGLAERLNSSIINITRCLIKHSGVPNRLWGEAASTAAYIFNRSIHSATQKTPYELWTGEQPSINHMKTFGCKAFGYSPLTTRRKLDDTSKEGFFVGYPENTKGFRIWVPETDKIIVVSKMSCNENQTYRMLNSNKQNMEPENVTIFDINYDDKDVNVENFAPRRSSRPNKGVPAPRLTY